MEVRELLQEYGYNADDTPVICGSALYALEVCHILSCCQLTVARFAVVYHTSFGRHFELVFLARWCKRPQALVSFAVGCIFAS